LVTVKPTLVVAARLALFVVMAPVGVLMVTPVDLLVACVTVPPAPVP
jgi:hypothetical protein